MGETFDTFLAAMAVPAGEPLTSAQLLELITVSGLPGYVGYPVNTQVVIQSELLLYYDFPRVQLHCLRQGDGSNVLVLERNIEERDGVSIYGFAQVSLEEADQILQPDDVTVFWEKIDALTSRPCVVTADGHGQAGADVTHKGVFDDVVAVTPAGEVLAAWVETLPDVTLRFT